MRTAWLLCCLVVVPIHGSDGNPERVQGETRLRPLEGETAHSRRRPFRRTPPLPTSESLITGAFEAGEIDLDTAVRYRIFADFGDERLPAAFRGDDRAISEATSIQYAVENWESLDPMSREELTPFMIQPFYAESWWHLKHGKGSSGGDESEIAVWSPGTCPGWSLSTDWESLDVEGFRIWYEKGRDGDRQLAEDLGDELKSVIAPRLVEIFGREVLSDNGAREGCRGGSDALDIILIDNNSQTAWLMTQSGTKLCEKGSAYMLLQRDPRDGFYTTAAHELAHAHQFGFTVRESCDEAAWMKEAFAQNVQDLVYPDQERASPAGRSNTEHQALLAFLYHWWEPLEEPAREYGAYLLPFYAHRVLNLTDFTKQVWENLATADSLTAIDRALPGGFAESWPEFTFFNWNDPRETGLDTYFVLDEIVWGVSRHPSKESPISLRLDSSPDKVGPLERVEPGLHLKHLSAEYFYFSIDDPRIRTLVFVNGMNFELEYGKETLGTFLVFESSDAPPGVTIRVALKVAGHPWAFEDWSGEPWRIFCLRKQEEQLEKLLIVVSNSQFSDRDAVAAPPAVAPLLYFSNIGCGTWSGTASCSQKVGGMEETTKARVKWHLVERTGDPNDLPTTPGFAIYEPSGTVEWSISGTDAAGCTVSGSDVEKLTPGQGLSSLIVFDTDPQGAVLSRSVDGYGLTPEVSYTETCEGETRTLTNHLEWLDTPTDREVSSDGGTIKGHVEHEFGRCEWEFHVDE